MSLFIRASWVLMLCVVGCGSGGAGGGDLGGGGGGGGGGNADLGSNCSPTSPSGYACDPWSTHLYMAETITRQGGKVRLLLIHNPENEGGVNDMTVPPEHDYSQLLTVDLDLTPAVRQFLCVVFTPGATPASFDASSPGFLTAVDHSIYTLLSDDTTFMPHVANLTDVCGGATLAGLQAPTVAMGGRPALADLALAIPLSPKPKDFTVGTTFSGWVARGILYVDEQSELTPAVTGTVVAVQ